MNNQHKWHKEIKAWADGAEIECRDIREKGYWGPWSDSPIDWNNVNYEFRVKQDPVVEIKYFQKTSFQGYVCYMEFTPDLEKWDMKITYVDGRPNEVLLT